MSLSIQSAWERLRVQVNKPLPTIIVAVMRLVDAIFLFVMIHSEIKIMLCFIHMKVWNQQLENWSQRDEISFPRPQFFRHPQAVMRALLTKRCGCG